MKIPFLIGIAGIAGAILAAHSGSPDPLLDKHTQQLQAATSLTASYSVQMLPGGPVDYKLEFAKPAKFRLESSQELEIGDGTTTWTYRKAANTYTEMPQTAASLNAFLGRDAVLPWTAFFSKDPFKDASQVKDGPSHTLRGKTVTDVSMSLMGPPERTATLYIDQELGIARGAVINAGPDRDTIILSKALAVSNQAPPDSDFAFNIPAGAKKVNPAKTWEGVSGIFKSNCTGCHNATRPRHGLDLSSYAGAMAGGQDGKDIVAGDPDNSPMMAYLKANGKPQMPPPGPLSDDDVAKIQGWIKAGATEK